MFYQLLPLVWRESWWKPRQTQGNVSGGVESTDGAGTLLRDPFERGDALRHSVGLPARKASRCPPTPVSRTDTSNGDRVVFSDTVLRREENGNCRQRGGRRQGEETIKQAHILEQSAVHTRFKTTEHKHRPNTPLTTHNYNISCLYRVRCHEKNITQLGLFVSF